MIYVSKAQLKQVEYLIGQSIKGHHVLFDSERIRRVLKNEVVKEKESIAVKEVERHIEQLVLQPTLLQKRAYLERLEPEMLDQVVRVYFNIVENNLLESSEVRH